MSAHELHRVPWNIGLMTLYEYTYPIPLGLLPENMEAKFRKVLDATMEDRRGLRQQYCQSC